MVQRKAPHKIGSQAETTKRSHVKLERQSSCHQRQETRSKGGGGGGGGGGGDLKKKLKLERSIRAADLDSLQDSPMKKPKKRSPARASPNYMKPTSSSDARKEQLQVTLDSQTARNWKNLNPKKPSSPPSCTSPGLNLSRPLSRQSSLKTIRPLMVKSLIKGVVVNRATCSSTLKDSKFPEALDLNPGGTEAEGTSVMRVCPYTYCSLNGHRHEPLPPLRCFMSARRKLLKTQKSMKLKGLSPLRVKALGKDKEIDTGQKASSKGLLSRLEVAPPMEEEPDDFFVEIYTNIKPEEEIITENNHKEGEIGKPQVLEEDYQMKEPCANAMVEDGVDQISELSNEEVDVTMSFLEYVECDPQVDDAEEEETPSLLPEDNGELCVDCYEEGLLGKADDCGVESENKVSTFDFNWEEEAGSPFPDNTAECSECPGDCSRPMLPQTELSTEQIAPLDSCDVAEADAEQKQEVNQEADAGDISLCDELSIQPITDTECGVDEAEAEFKQEEYPGVAAINEGSDQTSEPQEPESSEDNDDTRYLCDSKDSFSDKSSHGFEEVVSEEPKEGSEAGFVLPKLDNDESNILKPDDPEEQQNMLKENVEEEENVNEVEDTNSLSIVQLFDSSDDLNESDQGLTEDGPVRNQPETVLKCDDDDDDDAIEDASISSDSESCSSIDQSDEIDIGVSWESEKEQQEEVIPLEGSIAKSKARTRIRRKKITEDPDAIRDFNPRPPRFLDVEPDPEAEKVDLRHQMMDERKNSEEYLIDYALRNAVTKLAPARKRKVALLVEAFETVMPPPACEKPIRHPTSGFVHARIMQACI